MSTCKIFASSINKYLLQNNYNPVYVAVRCGSQKHYLPKWREHRRKKVMKVELPDFQEPKTDEAREEKVRTRMKLHGLYPMKRVEESPHMAACTSDIFQAYIPPEGDGKFSVASLAGVKQKGVQLEKKTRSMLAIRNIKKFEEGFDTDEFAIEAQDIYIKAHECLANKDKEGIQKYITEKAYPEMLHNIENKTIHWKFLESLEPPRVVHARVHEHVMKNNMFAQVTIRFNTQQILAVYDRFGRLMHGSEILKKDVLEYIVFEKHLAYEYGTWRIHAKIIPPWMPPRDSVSRTYAQPPPVELEPEEEEKKDEVAETVPVEELSGSSSKPQLAAS